MEFIQYLPTIITTYYITENITWLYQCFFMDVLYYQACYQQVFAKIDFTYKQAGYQRKKTHFMQVSSNIQFSLTAWTPNLKSCMTQNDTNSEHHISLYLISSQRLMQPRRLGEWGHSRGYLHRPHTLSLVGLRTLSLTLWLSSLVFCPAVEASLTACNSQQPYLFKHNAQHQNSAFYDHTAATAKECSAHL